MTLGKQGTIWTKVPGVTLGRSSSNPPESKGLEPPPATLAPALLLPQGLSKLLTKPWEGSLLVFVPHIYSKSLESNIRLLVKTLEASPYPRCGVGVNSLSSHRDGSKDA